MPNRRKNKSRGGRTRHRKPSGVKQQPDITNRIVSVAHVCSKTCHDILAEEDAKILNSLYPKKGISCDASGIEVLLNGQVFSHSGFSKMNREIALRLNAAGAKIKLVSCDNKVDISGKELDILQGLTKQDVSNTCPCVFSMTMPPTMGGGRPRILYTMIETSNRVHPEYAEKMDLATEVWVPTSYMSDMLESTGIHSPVYVMPLGVNHDIFRPDVKPMKVDAKGFKFVSVFWWSYRKGYDILIKSYVQAFSAKDDVSLIISTKPHPADRTGGGIDGIAKAISQIVASTGKSDPPNIILHNESMDEARLASLYTACDAFILPSRGEGFGLPLLEAGSCGLPIITSNCTAQSALLDNSTAYLIDPDGYEVSKICNPTTGRMAKWCRYYEDQEFPFFHKNGINKFSEAMKSVYNNRSLAKSKASALRRKILSELTWDHAVAKITDRLRDMV